MYLVTVSYPDGHLEEIDDSFETLEQAKAFGKNIMAQIAMTEEHKKTRGTNKPYYMVLDKSKRPSEIVYTNKKIVTDK